MIPARGGYAQATTCMFNRNPSPQESGPGPGACGTDAAVAGNDANRRVAILSPKEKRPASRGRKVDARVRQLNGRILF